MLTPLALFPMYINIEWVNFANASFTRLYATLYTHSLVLANLFVVAQYWVVLIVFVNTRGTGT